MRDDFYMERALYLAALGQGSTSPNPMVGAVIVKNNDIIAEGWHEKAGLPHAEVVALNKAGDAARDADMYVSLEPCSHYGKTSPCVDAIIEAGIKRVVVAVRDPNPLVSGNGIAKLKAAGIKVEEGLMAKEAERLNEVFFQWIKTGVPFVVAKYAMSLDGKIATRTGDSKWISCPKSRELTHKLRNIYDAILVGFGTVKADNPALTCRLEQGRNPVRVIVDSRGETPLDAQVLNDGLAQTIMVLTDAAPTEKIEQFKKLDNVRVITMPQVNGWVDLESLLRYLGSQEITSVLVEGGSTLNASLLAGKLVDKVQVFIAPIIIGGQAALGPVGGCGVETIAQSWQLTDMEVEKIGSDVLLSGYLHKEKK